MITLDNFKLVMKAKAEEGGLYENFGQNEISKLKDKYRYNPYGTEKERHTAHIIDGLDDWASNFTGNN